MKDLRSQLVAQFGESQTPEKTQAPAASTDPLLLPDAHHRADWWKQACANRLAGAPKRNPGAALNAAIQQTDGLLKALKRAGQKSQAAGLADARKQWMDKRAKVAWAEVKRQLGALGVSDKLYRSLKQGTVDPVLVLDRLGQQNTDNLRGISVKRFKAILGG